MTTSTRIRGYSVKGRDDVLGTTYVTGLESTERKARKTLQEMLASTQYSLKEKKTMRVIRILEVIEEI
jgi:hypothetical protein